MKVLIQRVKKASVWVNQKEVSTINHGYLLLVGVCKEDSLEIIEKMAYKIVNIRLFSDSNDKMNLNIKQVSGSILSVSQFTLCANHKKGHRPSFDQAMNPTDAKNMFDIFNKKLLEYEIEVKTGVFQEHMNVIIDNDGPVTVDLTLE